jgi:hypothetical protein
LENVEKEFDISFSTTEFCVKILQLECCSQKKNIEAKDWVQPF